MATELAPRSPISGSQAVASKSRRFDAEQAQYKIGEIASSAATVPVTPEASISISESYKRGAYEHQSGIQVLQTPHTLCSNMSTQKKLILVIGATGAQGLAVVDALLAPAKDGSPSPYTVRALTRDVHSRRAQGLEAKGVELFPGALTLGQRHRHSRH